MHDQSTTSRRKARWASGVGLLAAGAIGGAVLAGTLSASATPVTTASASTAQSSTSSADTGPRPGGHGGATPVRSDEKSLSATLTATLRAKALKAVPGGTVYRMETDAGDATYEAHMTKADGSLVTVKFDKSLKVTKVESGMGTGDPQGHGPGAPGGPGGSAPGGSAPGGSASGSGRSGSGTSGSGTLGSSSPGAA